MEGDIREGNERQMRHRITCKDYVRKYFIDRCIERFKEQYSPANTDVWMYLDKE